MNFAPSPPAARVAIVGAGLAGLSCARRLREQGCLVRLFDKSGAPGGRMATRHGEGWQCDHGAQYFTVRDPDFQQEVARWIAAGRAAAWPVRPAVLGGGGLRRAAGAEKDAPALVRYVGTPSMRAAAEGLAADLPVSFHATITALERDGQGWRLHSREQGADLVTGDSDRFDAVVLALPAPQAQALAAPHSALLARRADAAAMHPCWALMLRYDLPPALPFEAAFVNSGPLRWIARDSAKPGRGGVETWLLHAESGWSSEHRDSDAQAVAAELLAAFSAWGAPAPAAWTAHRWLYAQTEAGDASRHAWDPGLRLGLAGDWLAGGRVEGAWLSGRALADSVAASCSQPPADRP
ncbi:MAG: FAD-dependent oxidoreductase [Burkholderiales bacterium]|nr:FAD-dependent oxidoreductase [Burkholderiales bacterium]